MKNSEVGDDVYKDDPTVNKLQEELAKLFGKEKAIFVPSGTMSNLIGLMVNVRQKGEAAMIGSHSHVLNIERGGMSAIGGIHPIAIQNLPDGSMDLNELEYNIPPVSDHLSQPRVICLESSHNVCNGRVPSMKFIDGVKKIAKKHKLRMHLDGARCLNAATKLNIDPAEMVKAFDTVNFCLSKGMGCPIGSVLMGKEADIQHASIIRKMLGGQMRQVGTIASCGLVALEDWRERLQNDHDNARYLAEEVDKIEAIDVKTGEIETNIFRFQFKPDYKKFNHVTFAQHLKEKFGILMNPTWQKDAIRVVTHRDVSRKDLEYVAKCFKEAL